MSFMAADDNKSPGSMDPRELAAQLRYLQDLYSQQYQALQDNIATFTIAQSSLQRNIELLEKAGSVEGQNILLDGEGGTYLNARLEKLDRVLVYVGAGYIIEKDLGSATSFLKDNAAKGEQLLNRLTSDRQKIEKELINIAVKLNALQQQMQGQ